MLDDYVKIYRDLTYDRIPENLPVYIVSESRKTIPKVIPLFITRDEYSGGLRATCLISEKSINRFHVECKIVYKKWLFFKQKPAYVQVKFVVDPFIKQKENNDNPC